MANVEIRQKAKTSGVPLWKVAKVLKISEPTMTRLMREELSSDKAEEISSIIDNISNERTGNLT